MPPGAVRVAFRARRWSRAREAELRPAETAFVEAGAKGARRRLTAPAAAAVALALLVGVGTWKWLAGAEAAKPTAAGILVQQSIDAAQNETLPPGKEAKLPPGAYRGRLCAG
ncbi:hypothetical protein AB0F11_35860 [Streptomyces sp. NPDC032472]|uniref:hypothetical protein n=1 Tax=Streptomyces sp. NPDC032472 TaxID=3155018 RepID=UPI0033C85B62